MKIYTKVKDYHKSYQMNNYENINKDHAKRNSL